MTKYIGIAVAALMTMLTLGVFTASAFAEKIPDTFLCYKISEYKYVSGKPLETKGGLYEKGCEVLAATLKGEYELAELLFPLPETPNLWCALIKGLNTDGYYKGGRCNVANSEANKNDWTDVVKEHGSEGLIFEFTEEPKFEASWGKSKLNAAGAEIKCEKAVSAKDESVNKKLGKVYLDFTECSFTKEPCTSTGEASGTILVPTEWHLVPPLGRIVFLVKTTNIECKVLKTKVEIVEGSTVVGKIGPWGKKGKTFEIEVNVSEGEQEYSGYENNANELVKTELKASVNGGKAKAATQEDEKATITTEKETELVS